MFLQSYTTRRDMRLNLKKLFVTLTNLPIDFPASQFSLATLVQVVLVSTAQLAKATALVLSILKHFSPWKEYFGTTGFAVVRTNVAPAVPYPR